jgi:hypothetical protein
MEFPAPAVARLAVGIIEHRAQAAGVAGDVVPGGHLCPFMKAAGTRRWVPTALFQAAGQDSTG